MSITITTRWRGGLGSARLQLEGGLRAEAADNLFRAACGAAAPDDHLAVAAAVIGAFAWTQRSDGDDVDASLSPSPVVTEEPSESPGISTVDTTVQELNTAASA